VETASTIKVDQKPLVETVSPTQALALASSPPLRICPITPAILDTGCTATYITNDTPHTNKKTAQQKQIVSLPNGDIMHSTHTALLQLHPALPEAACTAHIFPALKNPLISIGQLLRSKFFGFRSPNQVPRQHHHNWLPLTHEQAVVHRPS
jgi:hypothetical protein